MPGIYGLVSKEDTKSNLIHMSKSMYLYEHFIQDELFYDDSIAASRAHTGLVGTDHSPIKLNELYVWVEGEAYNVSEVAKELNLKANSLPTLLLKADESKQLDKCLNRLDGYFCAAIYDKENQKIKLISDRYGMRLLYWYHKDGIFAWGSEVKAILAIEDINKELNPTSYDCFMDLGYLLGENTWFKQIKLIKPATVLEYDLNSESIKQSYYWKWSEIKPSNISFNQAVDKLGELHIQAVSKRFNPNEFIGIAISGGLDSRAIFAALNYLYPNYKGYAYTFGIPKCDDIEIANKVISLSKNWQHEVFFFTSSNWFQSRIKRVWDTDGMQDMMHMHGSEFLPTIAKHININLNGYIGGEAFGDSYQEKHKYKRLNSKMTLNIAKEIYGKHSHLIDYNSDFYDINHIEPLDFMNRSRRFINMGTTNSLTYIHQRKPQMDNKVIELIFSLPDEYRINNKLYSEMLKKYFPIYFNDIPWQKTGKPVGIVKKPNVPTRIINKAKREALSLLGIKSNQNYTDYPNWIRDQEVSKQLLDLLDPKNAEYARLISDDLSKRWLEPHLKDKKVNYASQILRAATIEVYLKQVFRSV